ncbi:MAG: HlyD family efflux transporter periplasmic adaptor subunit [Nitrospirae bacterium]|nr:HlyD family efflux transporter periplasmic adaptor subunit [Nitrospirota bacterium]
MPGSAGLISRSVLALLSAIVLIAASGCNKKEETVYQGYAEGEFVLVAAQSAGRLEKRWVQRGQEVAANAPLFALEQENEKSAAREAEARMHIAEANLANITTGRRQSEIEALTASIAQAEAARRLSLEQLERYEKLFASGYVSREQLDEIRASYATNTARVAETKAQLRTAQLSLGRDKEIDAARTGVDAARAVLAQSSWRLEQRAVHAPAPALVHDTFYSEGEWVQAGSPVVSLLPPGNIKLRFFVPEPVLGLVKTGQMVSASCDGCGKPIAAKVSYISRQPEYTPPLIYSREQNPKLVFLIEAWPDAADAVRLHPGQPMEIKLK